MKKTSALVLFVVVFIGMMASDDSSEVKNFRRTSTHSDFKSQHNLSPSHDAPSILASIDASKALRDPDSVGSSRMHARYGGSSSSNRESHERIAESLISAPGVFERTAENSAGAQFAASSKDLRVELTSNGIKVQPLLQHDGSRSALEISLRGSGPFVWQGENRAPGETNYFIGNDATKWRTHVARYDRAETTQQRGVKLAVHASSQLEQSAEDAIEYDVYADAGVDPTKLRFELNGAHGLRLDRDGNLLMRVSDKQIRMEAPAIYEQVSASATGTQRKATSAPRTRKSTSSHSRVRGPRRQTMPRKSTRSAPSAERRRVRKSMHDYPHGPRKKSRKKVPTTLPLGDQSKAHRRAQNGRKIDGGYVLETDGSVGFWVGQHDRNAALLIDPSLTVTYDTFLGGIGADSVNSMTMDSAGNVYVAGTTTAAATFPEEPSTVNGSAPTSVNGNIRGDEQLFVAKITFSNGIGTLQYLTFFGGSNTQAGGQVAVDPNGNAAVLGTSTSPDYPVTDGSQPTPGLTQGNGNDLVVSEVDPSGSSLLFSTLFGGSGTESATANAGIPLNSSLNIPAGQGGIAFDASGNIYVASDTSSRDLPTTGGSYQASFGGKLTTDGFVAEFQPQNVATGTNDLLYCSYLGTNSDRPVAIGGLAVDSSTPPGVYIAGSTNNSVDGFPIEHAVQSSYGGGASDAFLMKMQLAGNNSSDLIYATLLGGSAIDEAFGVAVDSQGSAYVVGATQSPTFPFPPQMPALSGPSLKIYPTQTGTPSPQNVFLAVVGSNAAGDTTLQYFTYLGGSNQDAAEAVAVPAPGTAYVSGTTTSYNFGWHNNLQPFNGTADAFVAKLDTTKSGANSLLYATPLGGTFVTPGATVTALGNGVVANGRGDVYVAGQTTAIDFPSVMTSSGTVNGFQQICGSCQEQPAKADAFITAIREGIAASPAVSFGSANVNFGSGGVQIGSEATPPQIFTITNTGEADLNFSTTDPLTITGPNNEDFPVAAFACPQSLSPGQTCQAELNFIPSTAGVEGSFVSIRDDAPGSPQLLEVTGIGVGPLTVLPSSFDFGDVPLNTTSPLIVVTLTAGTNTVIQEISDPGAGTPFIPTARGFGQPLCIASPNTIAPGSQCAFAYSFQPTTLGTFQAELDIAGQANGVPFTEKLPMVGTGVPAIPIAVAAPSQLVFRSEPLKSTETLSVQISNTGTAPLILVRPLAFSGTNASDFSETDNCPASIPPFDLTHEAESSCNVSVLFTPQTLGSKAATLAITDNGPGGPQLIALAGTAVPPPIAQITPASLSLNFGTQGVGTPSSAAGVLITNTGGAPLHVAGIEVDGANAADFQENTANCLNAAIAPQASCNISVTFSPQVAGSATANLTVSDDAQNSPQIVTLSGTGVLLAHAQVSPVSVNFGSQTVGTISPVPQAISIENTGSAPLTFASIDLNGANPGDFGESDHCSQAAQVPNATCTVFVSFSPLVLGPRAATLTITSNGSDGAQTVALTGTSVSPPQAQLTSTIVNFGSVSLGTQSSPISITLANPGGTMLSFAQAIGLSGANAADFKETDNCSVGVAAGSSCAISVRFLPRFLGNETATLYIYDSAPDSPQSIALSGLGSAAPQAQVSTQSLDFGGESVGSSGTAQTITIKSVGPGQPLTVTGVQITSGSTSAPDFSETDNCSAPITASCAIQVTFTPSCQNEPAARSAILTIQDNGTVPSQTVTLTGTATGDFCLSTGSSPVNETISTGGTAATFGPISIISVSSFSGTVNLACNSNPVGPTCTFSPSATVTVSPNLPVQFQVQAATSALSVIPGNLRYRGENWNAILPYFLMSIMSLLAMARRRNGLVGRVVLTAAALGFLCIGFAACGGGGGGAGSNASSDPPPSLAGSYTLSVTASDGSQPQTLSLHLNVAP